MESSSVAQPANRSERTGVTSVTVKLCTSCNEEKTKEAFSSRQWSKGDRRCRGCIEGPPPTDENDSSKEPPTKKRKIHPPESIKCSECNENKPAADYFKKQRRSSNPKCRLCLEQPPAIKSCTACNREKTKRDFTKSEWRKCSDGKCRSCLEKIPKVARPTSKQCAFCNLEKPIEEFFRVERKKDSDAKCRTCCSPTSLICGSCNEKKVIAAFHNAERKKGGDAQCRECLEKRPGQEKVRRHMCGSCDLEKPFWEFSKKERGKHSSIMRCCACIKELKRKGGKICESCSNEYQPQCSQSQDSREDDLCEKCTARHREEVQQKRAEESKKKAAAMIRDGVQLRRLGCERYDDPCHDKPGKPSVEELSGDYDIFYYSACAHQTVSRFLATMAARKVFRNRPESLQRRRATRGWLTLSKEINPETGCSVLHGSVDIDQEVTDSTCHPLIGDFSLRQSDDILSEATNAYQFAGRIERFADVSIPLEVTPTEERFAEDVCCYGFDGGMIGQLMTVNRAVATRLNLNEDRSGPFDSEHLMSLEEGSEFAKEAKGSFLAKSWLCNHLKLDKEIAWRIHSFTAFRPPPVLGFVPDDLWLSVTWGNHWRQCFYLEIFARRTEYSVKQESDGK